MRQSDQSGFSLLLICYKSLIFLDGQGDWSSAGCNLIFNGEEYAVCMCDHLTHFAITVVRLICPTLYVYSITNVIIICCTFYQICRWIHDHFTHFATVCSTLYTFCIQSLVLLHLLYVIFHAKRCHQEPLKAQSEGVV